MTMRAMILYTVLACGLAACGTEKVEIMKSPCASAADDSPCGPKRPVNDWWMKAPKPV